MIVCVEASAVLVLFHLQKRGTGPQDRLMALPWWALQPFWR